MPPSDDRDTQQNQQLAPIDKKRMSPGLSRIPRKHPEQAGSIKAWSSKFSDVIRVGILAIVNASKVGGS
ncbi:MAG: hypothetical protein ABSF29_01595 [Tepidisphaeraceae bacterium]|jgi:hypothetical protein